MNDFLQILTSWDHWAFEAVSDAAFAAPAYLLGRWRLRVHDRRKHGVGA
jgi:hypothetical protein